MFRAATCGGMEEAAKTTSPGDKSRLKLRRRSYYTEEDANGFVYRKLSRADKPRSRKKKDNIFSAKKLPVPCQQRDEVPLSVAQQSDVLPHISSENTDNYVELVSGVNEPMTVSTDRINRTVCHGNMIVDTLAQVILSGQPELKEQEVSSRLQKVMGKLFPGHDVMEVLSLPDRPVSTSRLKDRIEEEKKWIQLYEEELIAWDRSVQTVVEQCDQQIREAGCSDPVSGECMEEVGRRILGDDEVSLWTGPVTGRLDVSSVRHQLENINRAVEDSLQKMTSVQEEVITKMEEHVDQLTAPRLPLPTQTPRTTFLQLKQLPPDDCD